MSLAFLVSTAVGIGVVGILIGYYLRLIISLGKRGSMELEIKQMMIAAKDEAQKITEEALQKANLRLEELKEEERRKDAEFKKTEERLIKKEELLDQRQLDIDREAEHIKLSAEEIKKIRERAEELATTRERELERVTSMTRDEAKEELMKTLEKTEAEDFAVRMQKLESQGNERLDRRAKDILATTIQRLASSTASEFMVTTVAIPSEDIKGKIIGKEGRNIRAFERAAGVELVVDETPGSIVISSFDPVRRQVARAALDALIQDGRIQPAKIEEAVEKAKAEINKIIKEKGEQAMYECGLFNFDPKLVSILGRLHFRTSYGQNVLQHSIEMAHIAGMLAEELGADVKIAKAGALYHDIGKAVDHEVQGTHVDIGRKILQKFNIDPRIIQAMQSHHEEYPYETLESVVVQTADALSGGRPGARRDSVEHYLKRLGDLEAIANSFPGVERSYALQAGREIRVFVSPAETSDLEAKKLARGIALRIEQELKYPGEIKVNVIRESRSIEFAR